MRQCDPDGNALGGSVYVLKTEEKGSDVNLAVDLLHDCIKKLYDCAVIVSNDSDLARSVRIVREQYGKTIGIANPHATHQKMSGDLRCLKRFEGVISRRILSASQFPDEVPIGSGTLRRPSAWL